MKRITLLLVIGLGTSDLIAPSIVLAAVPFPGDLFPGEGYRLVFVTSSKRDATSTIIGDYDSFVQGVANSAGIGTTEGVIWQAIASTDATAASDHIGLFPEPVYNMNIGEDRVANNSSDLFDGNLANFIRRDELNNLVSSGTPWTGSDELGQKAAGNLVLGAIGGISRAGDVTGLSTSWLSQSDITTTEVHRFYALSARLTVPIIPEPSSIVLLALAASIVLGGLARSPLRQSGVLQRKTCFLSKPYCFQKC